MTEVEALHFLRPWWLAGIPLALLLAGLAGLRHRIARQWRGQIAPHLLAHLVVRPPRTVRPGPRVWMAAMLSLACIAMAGPSWQREPPAFSDDRGQLLIVLDLAPTMNAIDVAPTRLARAKQKIGELLAQRNKARTGLLVFSESVHTVVPPTDDPTLVRSFLGTLESSLMPPAAAPSAAQGTVRLSNALAAARALLARDTDNPVGTVLVITDGRSLGAITTPVDGVILWLFGGPVPAPLANASEGIGSGLRNGTSGARDEAAIEAMISRNGFTHIDATVNDDDVQSVHQHIEQQLATAAEEASSRLWQDGGLYLLGPLLLLAALGFRRGWSLRW